MFVLLNNFIIEISAKNETLVLAITNNCYIAVFHWKKLLISLSASIAVRSLKSLKEKLSL